MAGFVDLVEKAQPALVGGGVEAAATEGRTWSWTFVDVLDDDGNPIDMTTGVTGTCAITERGTPVLTLSFTGGVGEFTVGTDEANTANLAASLSVRRCSWSLTISDGSSSVQVWTPVNSSFSIYPE